MSNLTSAKTSFQKNPGSSGLNQFKKIITFGGHMCNGPEQYFLKTHTNWSTNITTFWCVLRVCYVWTHNDNKGYFFFFFFWVTIIARNLSLQLTSPGRTMIYAQLRCFWPITCCSEQCWKDRRKRWRKELWSRIVGSAVAMQQWSWAVAAVFVYGVKINTFSH